MPYAELHCHSNFSLLDGASHPEELVAQAAALGLPALALTDHNAVYGAVRFQTAARAHGVQPIFGAEMTLADDEKHRHHLTLLVENEAGWHNLCYLISRAQTNAPKGDAWLPEAELVGCTGGLIALSGCRQGAIPAALDRGRWATAVRLAERYRDLFGPDNFWLELGRHRLPREESVLAGLAAIAGRLGLGIVATGDVHYHHPSRRRLQDVLVCIGHNTTLEEAVAHLRPNAEAALRSPAQMAARFADYPTAVANSLVIAERCQFEPGYGLQDLPTFPTGGMSSSAYLRRLCQEGLTARYGEPSAPTRRQLQHELAVIEQSGLANYFLIVWDIVGHARQNGIRCQGRGSAANSLVAYLLHISPVDPLAHDLVFERFLSEERAAVPDIDVDFDAARREEVIQYIYERYGPAHTAMACTFVTFRARSAVRDIARALGLAPEAAAAAVGTLDDERGGREATDSPQLQLLLDLAGQIEGFPRHLGIHSGGMVVTGPPLMSRVPTEPATMPGRVVVQWDKEALQEAGLVKIDVLGLRMLTAVGEAAALAAESTGEAIDLDALQFDDPAVYEMIGRADTVGVFQVESRAQAQVLPRLRPSCFNDLVVSISLIRPGPVQGNMVHPYLRRRAGLEPVAYAHPALEPALKETLGVILFQEQVLKVARDLAGFTAGQGELLRRALGAKRATEEIERFRETFLAGAVANGVSHETAVTVFEQLRAFGGFSFAKSHAAAFAVLVYQSGWLKRYHPAAFYAALLNNQPMGFWNAAVLVNEAGRQGLDVRPVDVACSNGRCTVEADGAGGDAIRLGFNIVKGLGEAAAARIIEEREKQAFVDLADFARRTRLPRRLIENLVAAGAFDGWGQPRRRLLWELGRLDYAVDRLDLAFPESDVPLPPLSEAEAMLMEQSVQGLSAGDHVMSFYRERLREQGILGSGELARCRSGRRVRVAGLLVVHQSPPTAKGFHFLTLEDEDGLVNVVVRPPVAARYRKVLRSATVLTVQGVVQQEGGVTNLLAQRISPVANA